MKCNFFTILIMVSLPAHDISQLDSLSTLIWLNLVLEGNERTSVPVGPDVAVGVGEFKNSSLAWSSFFCRISGECRLWWRGFVRERSKVRFAFLVDLDIDSSFNFSSLISVFSDCSEIGLLGVKDNRFSCIESLLCGTVTCFLPQVNTPTLADFWTSFRSPENKRNVYTFLSCWYVGYRKLPFHLP